MKQLIVSIQVNVFLIIVSLSNVLLNSLSFHHFVMLSLLLLRRTIIAERLVLVRLGLCLSFISLNCCLLMISSRLLCPILVLSLYIGLSFSFQQFFIFRTLLGNSSLYLSVWLFLMRLSMALYHWFLMILDVHVMSSVLDLRCNMMLYVLFGGQIGIDPSRWSRILILCTVRSNVDWFDLLGLHVLFGVGFLQNVFSNFCMIGILNHSFLRLCMNPIKQFSMVNLNVIGILSLDSIEFFLSDLSGALNR